MIRTYAIGDIHGQLAMLEHAHRLVEEDRARTDDRDAPVVHLGDLVDRGPDSAGVVARLSEGIARGAPWVVLKGNHDRMFSGFLSDPFHHDPGLRAGVEWLDERLGGPSTLASYGVDDVSRDDPRHAHAAALVRVPEAHRDFLWSLPTSYSRGEAVFVHAGIRPTVPLADQREDDLLWIRGPFLDDNRDHGALVVHGHTALDAATHHGNRVNLDSGAGYGRPITAAVLEGRRVWLLTPRGRLLLPPPY